MHLRACDDVLGVCRIVLVCACVRECQSEKERRLFVPSTVFYSGLSVSGWCLRIQEERVGDV